MNSKILISLLVLFSVQFARSESMTITYKGQCGTYNPADNVCFGTYVHAQSTTEFQVIFTGSECPSGKRCKKTGGQDNRTCSAQSAAAGSCTEDDDCLSGYCAASVCTTTPAEGQPCVYSARSVLSLDTYCSSSGIVVKRKAIGEACTDTGDFSCSRICNSVTKKCDTFANTLKSLSRGAVVGGDANGYKTCNGLAVTPDADCTYTVNGVTKTATELGLKCMSTMFASKGTYYCQMGGNEQIFQKIMENVSFISLLTL